MSAIDRRIGVYGNVAIKVPCRVATTASITLSGLQTIDGVTLAEGDRVLVKNQSTTSQNGIYAADSGDWVRALDFNGVRDVVQGTQVLVASGVVASGTVWEVTTTSPVIGTTAIVWERLGVTSSSTLSGWYIVTDYGGDPTGVNDLSLAIQAAHDALPSDGGTIYIPAGTDWSCRSAVVLSKPCALIGAGRGLTVLNVGAAFAATSGVLLKFTGVEQIARDFKILGDITDPTQSYIGIQVDGPASFDFTNLSVYGCGVGFDFVQGNTGNPHNLTCRYFRVAGYRFGGTANKFSSEYRFYSGVITNPNSTSATNGTTTAPSRVINMASTTGINVGDGFAAYGIPAGAKVAFKTATTITIDQDTTGNIASGAYVRWGLWLSGICIQIKINTFDVNFTDMLIAGGSTLIQVTGEADNPNGIYRPDTIFFNNLNATASTYFGFYATGGTVFRFTSSWIGDVPFGNTFFASASTSVADDCSNFHFSDSLIGGAGLNGAYFDYANNIMSNNTVFVGNGQVAANTYNAIYCSPNTRGRFELIGGHAGHDPIDNAAGLVAYGVYLDTGSFAGVGDSVNIECKLSGTTLPILDGSSPAYPLKTINPFGANGRPAFRVGKSATQVIGAAAGWVKVTFPSEQFDFGNFFASSTFTPIAGVYQIQASVSFGSASTFQLAIYKNGLAQASAVVDLNTTGLVSDMVVADGNDTFEVYVNIPAGGTIAAGQDVTFFSGG